MLTAVNLSDASYVTGRSFWSITLHNYAMGLKSGVFTGYIDTILLIFVTVAFQPIQVRDDAFFSLNDVAAIVGGIWHEKVYLFSH